MPPWTKDLLIHTYIHRVFCSTLTTPPRRQSVKHVSSISASYGTDAISSRGVMECVFSEKQHRGSGYSEMFLHPGMQDMRRQ